MVSDLLYHQAEFDDYVELLRQEYRRKRNFMKLLDGMGYIRHLWQVAVSSSIGLQSRIQIAYKDGTRVVPSDPKTLLTEEEYLAIERRAEFRSEFHGGEMYDCQNSKFRRSPSSVAWPSPKASSISALPPKSKSMKSLLTPPLMVPHMAPISYSPLLLAVNVQTRYAGAPAPGPLRVHGYSRRNHRPFR